MGNAGASAVSNEETGEDPLSDIFASQGSVNLEDIPNFHSTDLAAAAAAIMTSSSGSVDDVEMLSSTSTSSEEEEELGAFLWDDMAGFDPRIQDLADLCPPH